MVRPLLVAIVGVLAAAQLPPIRLDVGGTMLHYVEEGQGHPVVLLHGGQGDYRAWQPQVEVLAPRFRVISYSRRNHFPNVNTVTNDHSARVDAADLAGMVTSLRLGPVHLIGTSYGALTALAFALEHRDQVRSLILAEPPLLQWAKEIPEAAPLYHEFMTDVHGAAGKAFAAGRDDEAMRTLIDAFDGAGTFAALSGERRARIMQNARFFKAITASSDPFPSIAPADVQALRIPTLVIRGANTDALHRLVTERLAALLPDARLIVIPNAGHGSPRQNPSAFSKAALDFLVAVQRR